MQRHRIATRIVLFVMMGVIFGLSHPAYAQAPEDDVFAVIKISNPEALLPKIAALVDKFQPGFGGMINPMMVGNMLFNNPEWTGMDKAGDYTLVVLNPMKYGSAPFGIIVPLTSKDDYLGALSQALSGGEETDGVHHFVLPNQASLCIAPTENAGVLSESPESATVIKSLIDADSSALSVVPVVKGQITASLSLSKILHTMQPMIDMVKQQALMGVQQEMSQGAEEEKQPQAEALMGVVESEIDMFFSLLNQCTDLELAIQLEDAGLRLSKAVFAAEESALAAFMEKQVPAKSELLGVFPSDSALLVSGSIEITPEFQKAYLSFVETLLTVNDTLDDDTVTKTLALLEKSFEAFGGDFAMASLSPTSESWLMEVISLKDADIAKEVFKAYPDMLSSFMGSYTDPEIDVQMRLGDTQTLESGEVMEYLLDLNTDKIADPEGQKIFDTLFGDTFVLPLGVTSDYAVAAFGDEKAVNQLSSIMEMLDSGKKIAAEHRPKQFGLPEKNNMFLYLSLPKILSWLAAKEFSGLPSFEVDAVDSPGIGASWRFVKSHFEAEMFIPVDEILAIKTLIEQAAPANE
ncbi:hypothetical protein CSB45_07560 [candidate division KSB3 bacterium]|uniref:DUF3352 domain-containing protein n=1 Tax=candidate division KSB3 bacterium TaxID=2044937 RepID=A0A2G6E5M5_9BACT|nr:MAG: hypothetical protein CSB45_07560 [candidate division KSB3 bacterium]PIE29892.1 MAG: hypothetical protein CSA57_06265 [candidate division KSB3 bacterium]